MTGGKGGWREALSLPRMEQVSTGLRTVFINAGFFAATLLLIPAVAGQFMRSAVVIEPIAVPKALVRQGLTPEVVANRLWDGLQEFAQSASAARETVVAIPDSQLVEFSLPDTGISIDSIFTQLRQFFGIYETRIAGEILCATPVCAPDGLRLRVRVIRNGSDIVDLPPLGTQSEQAYYREAAAGIFAIIDPYVAIAAQAERAPLRAETLARGLIADGTDAKWAHNLIGDIERRRGEHGLAVIEYQAALAIDPDFHVARANLALALGAGQHFGEARAALEELERRAPGNTLAPRNFATLAMTEGNREEAIRYFQIAAEREPLDPGNFASAGHLEIELGNFDKGVAYLNDALSIDPGHGGALDTLAQALWSKGDAAGAERLYRQWLEYEPDSASAHWQLGSILFATGKYEDALVHLDAAIVDMPETREQLLAATLRGAAYFKLDRHAEAIAAFEPLLGRSDDVAVHKLLAKSYEVTGRRQDAIALLETFLAEAPPDHASRGEVEAQLANLRDGPGDE